MNMTSEKGCRKDKNQNIQVFVRLRPLNQRERDLKSLGVVEVVNGREVVVRQSQQTTHTKRFTFDRAFSPSAKQVEVYQEVVSPLIEEVLNGYNCTVFAYGQTGTGKTHTMVGENTCDETTWQNDPLAGIIPRALSQLFDELRISNTEYTMRVSYLELYNEELFDLLSTSEDNSKLRIYEDVTRKGSNIVNGLEEVTVYNKTEVYKIMAQGQGRKRVASTLMNAQSSRSHTVFTILVHMKENSPEGEELVKIGKLNLVDLAGSENISKAGSDNPAKRERARECVNINQSLLTLGRVITALVERHPHIPYRESKLTRILQESLGGRTKTSIIATISPGHKDLEETMSTLEYANRAKNIQNKPEVNQKLTKKAILQEYAEEIDRLKRDLQAARDKNGVYLANETFAEITLKQEEQRKEIQELLLKKRAMEEERDRMQAVFDELNQQLEQRNSQLNSTVGQLRSVQSKLADTNNLLQATKQHCEEKQHLVVKQQETERALAAQARAILDAADSAAADAATLRDSAERRRNIESTNLKITKAYRDTAAKHRDNIANGLDNGVATIIGIVGDMRSTLEGYTTESTNNCVQSKQQLDQMAQVLVDVLNKTHFIKANANEDITSQAEQLRMHFRAALQQRSDSVQQTLNEFARRMDECLQRVDDADIAAQLAAFLEEWRGAASCDVVALRSRLEAFQRRMEGAIAGRALTAERQGAARNNLINRRRELIVDRVNKMKAFKQDIIDRNLKHMEEIEKERVENERILQECITRFRQLLEDNLRKRSESIEFERKLLEQRLDEELAWLEVQLEECNTVTDMAHTDLQQNIRDAEEDLHSLNTFTVESQTGSQAILEKIESLSEGSLKVVDGVKTLLLAEMNQTRDRVRDKSDKLINENRESMTQVADNTDKAIGSYLQKCNAKMDTVVGYMQETSSSTQQQLTALSTVAATLATASSTHQHMQLKNFELMQRDLERIHGSVRDELARLAGVEQRYLQQEYAVYNPTGSTPARTDYRYPRTLAATSPHERILERFRAMRHRDSEDDDCILLEGESETRTSDTDSSTSEDAAAFAAPSPAAPPAPPASDPPMPLTKCTSETEIYVRRRDHEQNGKENANRSMNFKKPSKLPAPAPQKRPLVERNEN